MCEKWKYHIKDCKECVKSRKWMDKVKKRKEKIILTTLVQPVTMLKMITLVTEEIWLCFVPRVMYKK